MEVVLVYPGAAGVVAELAVELRSLKRAAGVHFARALRSAASLRLGQRQNDEEGPHKLVYCVVSTVLRHTEEVDYREEGIHGCGDEYIALYILVHESSHHVVRRPSNMRGHCPKCRCGMRKR